MAIKIKSLEASPISKKAIEKGFLYKDISLDLHPALSFNNQLNKVEYIKDVQTLFDVEAVKNSVINALLTSPGEKILNPTYGIDLRRYLFEPVDPFTAELIRDDITLKLPDAEPRITVEDVTVEEDEENQQYNIELKINIPSLDVYGISIKSELASVGYTVL